LSALIVPSPVISTSQDLIHNARVFVAVISFQFKLIVRFFVITIVSVREISDNNFISESPSNAEIAVCNELYQTASSIQATAQLSTEHSKSSAILIPPNQNQATRIDNNPNKRFFFMFVYIKYKKEDLNKSFGYKRGD
jgi:hypothetical protein